MYAHWLKKLADKTHPKLWDFIQLTRFDKPIGIYLLLWPTLSALWIAAQGIPSIKNIIIFVLGVNIMRAAGCIINDYADRHFDAHVHRTQSRPLASKRLQVKQALRVFSILLVLAFTLVTCTNTITIGLSLGALVLACCYPFAKRYTYYPQLILGLAYSWGILMAFTAETGYLPWYAWVLYFANVAWTIAYDTYYAMTDREDDLKIGIKSTAILFGQYDRYIIAALQAVNLLGFIIIGLYLQLTLPFYVGLCIALGCFVWEYYSTQQRLAQTCFNAFLNNHWAGLAIFIGIIINYW